MTGSKQINPPPYKIPRQIYKPKGSPQINLDAGKSEDEEDGAEGGGGDAGGDEAGDEMPERVGKDPNAPLILPYKRAKKIHTVDKSTVKSHIRSLSENLTFTNGKKMAGYASVAP